MSFLSRLAIGLIVAVVAATLTTVMLEGELFNFKLLIGFFFATTTTAILVGSGSASNVQTQSNQRSNSQTPKKRASPPSAQSTVSHSEGSRVEGDVKWFNAAKGFGFIKQDNGEEVFVHFRSIRGTGRRALRDGQRVSFVVADSDKGPQAEDVEALG